MLNLSHLARKYDTDKAVHTHYLKNYEQHFGDLRDKDIRLLELGIHHGGSLLLWRDYFHDGVIVGLDVQPAKIDDPSGRIRTYQGFQQDSELLDRIAKENAPEGFDIVIDDCSHIGVLSRASFWHLFDKHLKRGGFYVIEDWGTGYWESWVDGVGYKQRQEESGYSRSLYRLTCFLSRLQMNRIVQSLPLAAKSVSKIKTLTVRPQYRSHDFGMVGFIKELIDELGMGDITHPQSGLTPHKASRFREMHFLPGHLFIVKT